MSDISISPVSQTQPLLIVEDSNEDFATLERFLRRSPLVIPIYRCENGDQALAFLFGTGKYARPKIVPRPGLIILDLNLPGTDGRQVLYQIKKDESLKSIPVVIFTTSSNPKDVQDCYQYGANSYITKPINFTKLKLDIEGIVNYWLEISTLPNYK